MRQRHKDGAVMDVKIQVPYRMGSADASGQLQLGDGKFLCYDQKRAFHVFIDDTQVHLDPPVGLSQAFCKWSLPKQYELDQDPCFRSVTAQAATDGRGCSEFLTKWQHVGRCSGGQAAGEGEGRGGHQGLLPGLCGGAVHAGGAGGPHAARSALVTPL